MERRMERKDAANLGGENKECIFAQKNYHEIVSVI